MKKNLTPEHIEYTGLFVDNPTKLLEMFPARHPKVFAHHSTNWYRPDSLSGLEIGKKSLLKIVGQAYDQHGFALLVENPKSKNKFPHITISCADTTAPVYSNELLQKAAENGSLEMFVQPFFIEVTEGYVDQQQHLFIRDVRTKNSLYKKIAGVALIVFGFVALIMPVIPGAWLIFVGLELLGFEILFWTKIKTKIGAFFGKLRK